jgi:hypothetical protein
MEAPVAFSLLTTHGHLEINQKVSGGISCNRASGMTIPSLHVASSRGYVTTLRR